MAERERRKDAFLAAAGWAGAARIPLAGDASFRRYERVLGAGRNAVLMDAPPPHEDVRPFLRMARYLRGLGYSAPEVLAEDTAAGLVLLEDLGDATYTRMLADRVGPGEWALYARAVDLLIDLHRRPLAETAPPGLAPYDDARLLAEALLLVDWYLPAVAAPPTPAVRDAYVAAWSAVLPTARQLPLSLVLRDYHVDNLMWLAERPGIAACGLLDFQDAVVGPVAYDLMSLLEDARRDIAPDLVSIMLAHYLHAFPALDRPAFAAGYAVLAAQRHAKVIGIFTRLCARDGKPQYLIHIPRVWRLLEAALGHPALMPVAAWFAAHVPAGQRRIPRCPTPR